jgi:Asp-tRNA(Asn)/Glu-tRNA(Gln) amidotransferase A subunit family amidase
VALIEQGRGVPSGEADAARADRARVRAELEGARREHEIDYWISPPAVGTAPAGLASTGDPIMNLPFTNAGLPTVTLPGGAHDGLPLGLQMAGGWYGDEALLRDAQVVEATLQEMS